jgi:putative transposase
MLAAEIRKRRVHHRSYWHWRWHLDEVFVRINGETYYLWRAVDHEGEVLEGSPPDCKNSMAGSDVIEDIDRK